MSRKLASVLQAMSILWLAAGHAGAQADDLILRAMRDEMKRSTALRLSNLEPPYFIEYGLHAAESVSISATLGALVSVQRNRVRLPRVQVRVGSYQFDNTNYVLADFPSGRGLEAGPMTVEDDYASLRHHLWLASDAGYKNALQAMARKRAALQNVTVPQELPDFAKAETARTILDARRQPFDEEEWKERLRRLSALFEEYPKIIHSSVDLEAVQGAFYYVNSEGNEARAPESVLHLRVRAGALAADGMPVRQAVAIHAREFDQAPGEAEIAGRIRDLAASFTALAEAPLAESYTGPVLFEGEAAAQLFAEALGRNLAARRRPVSEPGRPFPFVEGEFEGRLGSRILPEWMDVVDDPTQAEWRGRPLLGHYRVDLEGLPARPVVLVERGVLKSLLRTRQPVRDGLSSNGRARLPGGFGAKSAGFGNLFVRASQMVSREDLRRRLLDLARQLDRPYGIVVKKMDFPSSAPPEAFRRLASRFAQSGGAGRVISSPALAYRLYPDGREELVRGLRFHAFSSRSLRDIVAASEEMTVFEFLDNLAPFAWMGAGGLVAESAVVAPPVLFEELQLERSDEEVPKPPLAPPPPLRGREASAVQRGEPQRNPFTTEAQRTQRSPQRSFGFPLCPLCLCGGQETAASAAAR